jgi:hypothetical protein
MDKILFLDIDGVLNTYQEQKTKHNYIDPIKISRLEKVISATGAKIVISSNWRFAMNEIEKELPTIVPYIIGITGLAEDRTTEITNWINEHDVENYVVLDDMYIHLPNNFIQTNEDVGLTDSDAQKAINILNNPFDKIANLSKFFIKEAKAKPIYLYHGTHKSNLPSVMSAGLLANPKNRVWQEDPDASFHMPSRQSLEGVYLTPNLMTAYGSANRSRKKGRENPIIVIVEAQPNSLFLDEDEITVNFSAPGNNEYWTAYYYIKAKTDPEIIKEIEGFADRKMNQIETKFGRRLHQGLANRFKEIIKQIALAELKRKAAYINDWEYKHVIERFGIPSEEVLPKPNTGEAEAEYKKYQDLMTRALKSLAKFKETDDIDFPNTRLTNNIGFSGGNKIVAVIEMDDFKEEDRGMKLIYPHDISKVPQEALDKFMSDVRKNIGVLEFAA